MSIETREVLELCERLPAAERAAVANFARSLLARTGGAAASTGAVERWLVTARGVARPGVTTEGVMTLTRGEP